MNNKYDELIDSAQEIVLGALTEGREMTEDEKNRSQNMIKEAKQFKNEQAIQNVVDGLNSEAVEGERIVSRKAGDLGSLLVKNAQYQGWSKAIVSGGFVSEKARIPDSPSFTLRTPMHSKAVVTGLSDTSGGAFIRNEDSGVYQPLGYVPSTLRELVQVRQTQTDAVDYVSQTTKITQAAAVAEATSAAAPTVVTTATGEPLVYTSTVTPNAGGGYKPEGALAYARGTALVETLAVWIPATKRSIADSSQLRSIINQDLRDALNELLDQEILNGNGTPGFTGVANTPNILTQAFATDLLTSVRKGITQLSKNGEQATGIVLSPDDWETAELALAASAPYLPYTKSLWRIPVIEYSGTMTAKTGYIGNWRKAILWDREITQISISDSHADYFIRNLVAILGELRAAFAVVKPTAFVEVATQAA